jgi:hypothetical protein
MSNSLFSDKCSNSSGCRSCTQSNDVISCGHALTNKKKNYHCQSMTFCINFFLKQDTVQRKHKAIRMLRYEESQRFVKRTLRLIHAYGNPVGVSNAGRRRLPKLIARCSN